MVLALAAIGACGGGDDPEDEPDVSPYMLQVTPTQLDFFGDAGSATFTINASDNCDWMITKQEDWLTVEPLDGKGRKDVKITIYPNKTGSQRIALIWVSVKDNSRPPVKVTVTQAKSSDSDPSGPTEPTDPDPTDTQKEPEAGDNLPPS